MINKYTDFFSKQTRFVLKEELLLDKSGRIFGLQAGQQQGMRELRAEKRQKRKGTRITTWRCALSDACPILC